jgi:hypothetical protein
MNRLVSNTSSARSGAAVSSRQPTAEELVVAKQLVEEQKRILVTDRSSSPHVVFLFASAFLTRFLFLGADFDGTAGHSPIRNEDIQEYIRNLQRLDQTLANIETYIHIAYATLRNPDIVRTLFNMVSPSVP